MGGDRVGQEEENRYTDWFPLGDVFCDIGIDLLRATLSISVESVVAEANCGDARGKQEHFEKCM